MSAPTAGRVGGAAHPGPLPVTVRRARADDREAVLRFTTRTWDDWDYIPEVWDEWVAAPDGVLLVAEGAPAPGEPARPIAIARVALLSPTEGWLEGIRVEPAARGRDVATSLQAAALAWARALGATVVRYATGEENEASHRLGARHGFGVVASFRSYGSGDGRATPRAPGRVAPRLDGTRADEVERWWRLAEADPTLARAAGLYEWRAWSFQALTRERFEAHALAGEVVTGPEGGALAIVPSPAARWAGTHVHLSAVLGDGEAALELLHALETEFGRRPRVRLPDPEPPLLAGPVGAAWRAARYRRHRDALRVLARPLPRDQPLPGAPAEALTLAETPGAIAEPPPLPGTEEPGHRW